MELEPERERDLEQMMRSFVYYDVETEPVQEGCSLPRIVAHGEKIDRAPVTLHLRSASISRLAMHLSLGKTVVAHVASYDMATTAMDDYALHGGKFNLLRLIWDAYREGRIRCTKIREQLLDIAKGELRSNKGFYTLKEIAERRLRKQLNKGDDSWRLRYGLLAGVPVEEWPEEARAYLIDDVESTASVFWDQAAAWESSPEPHICVPAFRDEEAFQAECDFVFRLMEAWGVRADEERAREIELELTALRGQYEHELLELGLLKPKFHRKGAVACKREWDAWIAARKETRRPLVQLLQKWSDNLKEDFSRDLATIHRRVMVAYNKLGERVPSTGPTEKFPNGQVQTDRITLEESGDEVLVKLAKRDKYAKILQFIPVLARGADRPWNPPWKCLVTTGRSACGDEDSPGNLQQPPQDFNLREILIPREGMLYAAADLAGAEACGLAEMCFEWFGSSRMRDVINDGKDLHTQLAAHILGIPYDECKRRLDAEANSKDKTGENGPTQKARQAAKNSNFGFMGGMAVPTFMRTQRKKGIHLTEHEATFQRTAWFNAWPEMRLYFDRAAEVAEIGHMQQFRSGRWRGGLNFTTAANGPFQSLIADWAKDWLREVARECYLDTSSALYGCRVVMFLHDEIILEVPCDPAKASAAAKRLAELAVIVGKRWIKHVKIKSEPVLMRRWYKDAKPKYDATGLLVPWEPEKKEAA